MDPDATLAWILSLQARLDEAIEGGASIDEDAVYTLVGLVRELDGWLAEGRRPPARWRPALTAAPSGPLVLPTSAASNETVHGRRRRTLARRTAGCPGQLSLPLGLQGG